MNEFSPEQQQTYLQQLRRRQGTWVDWGHICQQLSKAGWRSEAIFAETGLEPSTQNQLIVAGQVFDSLKDSPVQAEFRTEGSDLLYELRLLSQQQRVACAEFVKQKRLDVTATREVVKAIKELSQYRVAPGFSEHPGDAVAFQCWRLLRQNPNHPDRVRLLSRGLSYAHTETARTALEQLLDPSRAEPLPTPPRLPWYRLESALEQPLILTLAGQLPLPEAVWFDTPVAQAQSPFGFVTGIPTVLALPGWPILRSAQSPVAVFTRQLPGEIGIAEPVLLVVERQVARWQADHYFLVAEQGQVTLQWFPKEPDLPLLGRLILALRPPKILDPEHLVEPWQIEE
ncbi:MAG: RuBisCO accumulation factor 1 [Gloeomargarita sp. DG_2_bins_126]